MVKINILSEKHLIKDLFSRIKQCTIEYIQVLAMLYFGTCLQVLPKGTTLIHA